MFASLPRSICCMVRNIFVGRSATLTWIADIFEVRSMTNTHMISKLCTSFLIYGVLCQSFQSQFGGGVVFDVAKWLYNTVVA